MSKKSGKKGVNADFGWYTGLLDRQFPPVYESPFYLLSSISNNVSPFLVYIRLYT